MSIQGYQFSELTQEQVQEIKKIENKINQNDNNKIVLLAFNKE